MMAMGFHWSSTTAITADGRQSQPVPVQIRSHLVNMMADNVLSNRSKHIVGNFDTDFLLVYGIFAFKTDKKVTE